nr:reverse transcriptase domain-containing protein [Tanacetum cinerariifolium]
MQSQQSTNAFVKETFMDLKTQLETVAKNHQASIQNLKTKFDRLADKQSSRTSGSLPSNTQPNPKGHNSKTYQPPQARNEHVNVVFTRSGKSYNPPVKSSDQQNDSENPINFDSDDEEDEEPTPQPKTKNPKPVMETPLPKPYKPKILYPQRLRKEKIEAQYGKFLDIIRVVRINVPLIDVLAGMPNYDKFLKELISNKHKIEQISAAFLSNESLAMIQNKVPPKLGDPGNFLIPCNFNKTFSCDALADLAENMLVEVGKFTFPADFDILKMEEDSKVPLILGRPFLHTADAVIRVKQKQLNLGVETKRMIFNIDYVMKHSYSNDDTCFSIDVIDEILEEDFDALLDEDQFEDLSDSNDEFTSIDDDSFFIDDIEYVEASPPDYELVSSEVMEIVIPEVGGIDDDIVLTIKDDILREKLLNVNLLISNIEALKDNPVPSFDFMTKSSSTFLNSLLEETNTFDNSLLEFETLCFDLEEISSGSTTTHSDISLSEYEAFYADHVKEISSGSSTTHSDSSLYDSFIFDLSINPSLPVDRSIFMSSPMNSLTSYLHRSMIVSVSRMNPTWEISLHMWWKILFQQENQEFMIIMFCPPIHPFN